MKYNIEKTNKFAKQYSKMLKVLSLLANDEILPPKYKNHLLTPSSKRHMGMSHTK